MIHDKDLLFLKDARNEDLRILADYLSKDKDGDTRFSETLTLSENYKRYYPDNISMMWEDLCDELQLYGGNTFMNIVRGHGVPYRTILIDVAKKLKVNFNKNASVELIERGILETILIKAIENTNEAELKQLIEGLGLTGINLAKGFTKQGLITALQIAIKGNGFLPYKLAAIIANQMARFILGRGFTFATNAGIMRGISAFAGPIGMALSILWVAIDIAGPAYRVTIPSVVQIAYMRIAMTHSPEDMLDTGI